MCVCFVETRYRSYRRGISIYTNTGRQPEKRELGTTDDSRQEGEGKSLDCFFASVCVLPRSCVSVSLNHKHLFH